MVLTQVLTRRSADQGHPTPIRIASRTAPDRSAAQPRIALYSHDTVGLGHRRRSLLLAQALSASAIGPVTLTVSGAADLGGSMSVPPGVDSLVLPALSKIEGEYRARRLAMSLSDLIAIRSATIRAALASFDPDLLIVDNVPRGAVGELDEALEMLRRRGRTRCVLGLRDILDEPEVVRAQWEESGAEDAIRRHYDAVWVYGDPAVYDLTLHYGFSPDVRRKVQFTGYLDPRERLTLPVHDEGAREALASIPSDHRLVLCLVGGGEDGGDVVDTFVRTPMPARTTGLVVTGPFMPEAVRAAVHRAAAGRRDLRVLDTHDDPTRLLSRADRVVMMGGYNTTCEVMAFERPALVVPRVHPRREQIIRAERLRDLGIMDLLHPDDLSPSAISAWLERPIEAPRVHGRIDMGGLARIPSLVAPWLPSRASRRDEGGRR